MLITILYGSQTGASQDVARRVVRELRRLGLSVECFAMDDYDIGLLPQQTHVVFIASTTGQGQVPDNMSNFWQFLLRGDLPHTVLAKLHYAIFGLGDSGYPMYNAVARRLEKRLSSLGAQPFCDIGLGDDQHAMGYDGGFILWLQALLQGVLGELLKLPAEQQTTHHTTITQLQSTIEQERQALSKASNTTPQPTAEVTTQQKIDYLAMPLCNINVIRTQNFDLNELTDLITQSPALSDIMYNAMAAPISTNAYDPNKLNFEDRQHVASLAFQYLDQHCAGASTSYHMTPPQGGVFNNEGFVEVLNNLAAQHQHDAKDNINSLPHHNKSIPPQLTGQYRPLPVLSTTPLVSEDHRATQQSVNHIMYDLSSLLLTNNTINNQLSPTSHQTTTTDTIQNPPYLPGDTLEVLPPTPDVLVNTLLTLYNLQPNDIVLTTHHNDHFQQILTAHAKPIHSTNPAGVSAAGYPLYNELSSLTDVLFDVMEVQDGLNEEYEQQIEQSTSTTSAATPKKPIILQRYETFPLLITAWSLFTWYVSLTFTPARHHFLLLAQQATNPSEKERLTDLCSIDYASTLDSYCIRERRSIVEVFADFPSALLPFQWLVELCDRIKPRQFSLASSSIFDQVNIMQSGEQQKQQQNTPLPQLVPSHSAFTTQPMPYPVLSTCNGLQQNNGQHQSPALTGGICIATVKYKTPFKRQKYGLCSTYLEDSGDAASQPSSTSTSHHTQWVDRRDQGYTINYPIREDLCKKQPNQHQQEQLPTPQPIIIGRVKIGSFRYNINHHDGPILAIGPGTGIAAFHAIVEYRVAILFHLIEQFFEQTKGQQQVIEQYEYIANANEQIRNVLFTTPRATFSQSSTHSQQYLYNTRTTQPEFSNTTLVQQVVAILKTLTTQLTTTTTTPQPQFTTFLTNTTTLITTLDRLFSPHRAPFTLLFGSRSIVGDHFYRDFFNYAVSLGAITAYHSVFSRINSITLDATPAADGLGMNDSESVVTSPPPTTTPTILTPTNIREVLALQSKHPMITPCINPAQFKTSDNTPIIPVGSPEEAEWRDVMKKYPNIRYVQHIVENSPELQDYVYQLVEVQYTMEPATSTGSNDDNVNNNENDMEQDEKMVMKLDFDNIASSYTTLHPQTTASSSQTAGGFVLPQVQTAGTIIVAGNAKKMPVDVQHMVMNLVFDKIKQEMAQCGDDMGYEITFLDVKKYINLIAKRGRYILECWM